MTLWNIFLIFPRKQDSTFHANCVQWRQFAWNVKFCSSWKNKKKITNLLSAEGAERVVKPDCMHIFTQCNWRLFYIVISLFTQVTYLTLKVLSKIVAGNIFFLITFQKEMKTWVRRIVWLEVFRPSQPNGVMSSAVSFPTHTFTGQA